MNKFLDIANPILACVVSIFLVIVVATAVNKYVKGAFTTLPQRSVSPDALTPSVWRTDLTDCDNAGGVNMLVKDASGPPGADILFRLECLNTKAEVLETMPAKVTQGMHK